MSTVSNRIAQGALWLLLVGLPLLLCVLVIIGDFITYGQLLMRPGKEGVLAAVLSYGWPILLAGGSSALVLGLGAIVTRRIRLSWAPLAAQTVGGVAGRLAILLALAYGLGSLVHLLLPRALLYFYDTDAQYSWGTGGNYWWPLIGDYTTGWTIYPPTGAGIGFVLLPFTEAACMKLGALLAVLAYQRRCITRILPKTA